MMPDILIILEALIIFVIVLFVLLVLPSDKNEQTAEKAENSESIYCWTCSHQKKGFHEDPCFNCKSGSKWEKVHSALDGQDDLD